MAAMFGKAITYSRLFFFKKKVLNYQSSDSRNVKWSKAQRDMISFLLADKYGRQLILRVKDEAAEIESLVDTTKSFASQMGEMIKINRPFHLV